MKIEFISGNGSSRRSLIDDRLVVIHALREALAQMGNIAPHGRDYVGAPEGAYEADRDEYAQRRELIAHVANAIEADALAIHELPGRP